MATKEITKAEMLYEQYNDKVANNYVLCYGRVYTDDNTYYKVKFVVLIDHEDLIEYYWDESQSEQDNLWRSISHKMKLDYAREIAINTLYSYKNIKDLYEYCNKTITDYNKVIRG